MCAQCLYRSSPGLCYYFVFRTIFRTIFIVIFRLGMKGLTVLTFLRKVLTLFVCIIHLVAIL